MTDDRIAELRRLMAEATPGPWNAEALSWLLRFGQKNDGPWSEECPDDEWLPTGHDARLITALRNALPALLAALDRKSEDDEAELWRRVEERWPNVSECHLVRDDSEQPFHRWNAYVLSDETHEAFEGYGPTRAAALRQLLEGE